MMHKVLLGTAAAALSVLVAIPPALAVVPKERVTQAQRDADAVLTTGAVGVQARVRDQRGKDQVVTSGVAAIGSNRPVPGNGHFRAASNAKAFTATVVLQLVGEGRLSLDDTVEELLPGVVHGHDNDGREITIRHLLQHQGGLRDDLPNYDSPADYYAHRFDQYTTEELVERAMRHKREFKPGRGWSYSNTGYLILGMVIEEVTGRPATVEINRRIIRPLGLRHTSFPTGPGLRYPHARGYQWHAGGQLIDVTISSEPSWAGVAGGLDSTTADLHRFYRALLGGRLLRPALLLQMKQTLPATELEPFWPGARDGLGLFSRPLSCGGVYWGHSGDLDGYMTRTGFTADGRRGVVASVSTNRSDSFESLVTQDRAVSTLIDNALCNRPRG